MARTASRERTLLMGRGLAAWMQAWSEGSVGSPPPGNPNAGGQEEAEGQFELPPGLEASVVQLLAGMTRAVLGS